MNATVARKLQKAGFSPDQVKALTDAFEHMDVDFNALAMCLAGFIAGGHTIPEIVAFVTCVAAAIRSK